VGKKVNVLSKVEGREKREEPRGEVVRRIIEMNVKVASDDEFMRFKDSKMPLGMDVGLSPGDFVLDGDSVPSPKGGSPQIFGPYVYCGQTAGWIKMALGMEVSLGPVHIVLDGDQKGGRAPNFRPIFIVAKRLDASRCHWVWR